MYLLCNTHSIRKACHSPKLFCHNFIGYSHILLDKSRVKMKYERNKSILKEKDNIYRIYTYITSNAQFLLDKYTFG